MADPYTWPDSDCLRNKLKIRDAATLEIAESRIVGVRNVEAELRPVLGHFNLDHLQRIHEHLFRDVYDWAGQTRTVEISKPGSRFAHWRHVDDQASVLLVGLHDENYLHGMNRSGFLARLAHYYGELNAIHPFREGNGRAQRLFLRYLANGAGWQVDWSALSQSDNVTASRRNLHTADPIELIQLFDPLVSKI